MSQTNPRLQVSGYLRGECRRAFAVYAFGRVHTQSGMQKKQQESMLYDLYHGSDKYPSHIKKLLNGEPPYAFLYDKQAVLDGSDTSTEPSRCFVMKEIFTKKESVRSVKPYVNLTQGILERTSFKSSALIQGRALLDLAKTSMRTIRKMLAILSTKIDSEGRPLESGKTMDDVWNEVLDELFGLFKGKQCLVEDSSASSSQESCAILNKRPEWWLPEGWIALHLFGPTAPAADQINLMTIGEPSSEAGGGKMKRGRKAMREEMAVAKTAERESDTTGSRGLSIGHRLGVAGLIINKRHLERDQKEQDYMNRHYHANRLIDSINQQIRIVELFPKGSRGWEHNVNRLHELQVERDEYIAKLRDQLESGDIEGKDGNVSHDYNDTLDYVEEIIQEISPTKTPKKAKVLVEKEKPKEDVIDKNDSPHLKESCPTPLRAEASVHSNEQQMALLDSDDDGEE